MPQNLKRENGGGPRWTDYFAVELVFDLRRTFRIMMPDRVDQDGGELFEDDNVILATVIWSTPKSGPGPSGHCCGIVSRIEQRIDLVLCFISCSTIMFIPYIHDRVEWKSTGDCLPGDVCEHPYPDSGSLHVARGWRRDQGRTAR